MRGTNRAARRWVAVLTLGLAAILAGACIVPWLSSSTPTSAVPTPTARPQPSPTALRQPTTAPTASPKAGESVTRISEQEMTDRLAGSQTRMGEGVQFQGGSVKIHTTGITISGTVEVSQLGSMQMPVEVVLQPVLSDGQLKMDVLDVKLGGAFASLSNLVKPLVASGMAGGVDVNRYVAEQGVSITKIELQEGYIVVTSVRAKQGN